MTEVSEREAIVAWLRAEEAHWFGIAYKTSVWSRLKMFPEVMALARKRHLRISVAIPYLFGSGSNHVAACYRFAADAISRGDHLNPENTND